MSEPTLTRESSRQRVARLFFTDMTGSEGLLHNLPESQIKTKLLELYEDAKVCYDWYRASRTEDEQEVTWEMFAEHVRTMHAFFLMVMSVLDQEEPAATAM